MTDETVVKMLSVNELNIVLRNCRKKDKIPPLGTFSEVDIVFIAGLFLWFKQNENNWSKIPKFTINDNGENIELINLFDKSEKKRDLIHQYYFNHIKILYNVDYLDIFEFFPNSKPSRDLKVYDYSLSFAPPIYITKENLNYFFKDNSENNIKYLKNKYKDMFDISNFINKTTSNYNKNKEHFTEYEKNVKERLDKYPPIYTFVFIIASKNLAEKKDETFINIKKYVEKLWLFTQDYVRGLYELAKNIVEHSGKNGKSGEGMITIRAYPNSKIVKTTDIDDKIKILETHVFDYGEKGIVPKLIEFTENKAAENIVINQEIKKCYSQDSAYFKKNNTYNLINYITPDKNKELNQQTFRHTSHYGISKLYKLITTTLTSKKLKSEMYVASKGQIERDYFPDANAECLTLQTGTHYYFKIPFIEENFKNIVPKKYSQDEQTAILGETASLRDLAEIDRISVKLNRLSTISHIKENALIDIIIDIDEITKENVDIVYNLLDNLLVLKDNNWISIDLQNKFKDASVLLRFLSYLAFEYKQPFILYNVDYENYKNMLIYNEDFYETRKENEVYWHNEQAMLLFVKTDVNYYFADILFGKDKNDFLFVNNIVSKTFPNSIAVLQEIIDKKNETQQNIPEFINSNHNLLYFFYPETNALCPFDVLIENKDEKPLFVSNLTTILEKPLFNYINEYEDIKGYIDNIKGFHISKTHFKIGTKIHSEDFYYAKPLFQNSFFTTRLAILLAFEIKKEINKNKRITLVGYEMYSELLLSLVEKFLKDFGFNEMYHFIAQDEDDNFKFKPQENYQKYLNNDCIEPENITIIIVPIASTGSTAKKIVETIYKNLVKLEKNKGKTQEEAEKISKKMNYFSTAYNVLWAKPENSALIIYKIEKDNIKIRQKEIISLPAAWYKINECPLCFGGFDERGYEIRTKPLYETDKSSLTPAIIFNKPDGKRKQKGEIESIIEFDKVIFNKSLKYQSSFRNNEFLIYSTDTNLLISENNSTIMKWLVNVNENLKYYKYEKYINNKLGNLLQNDIDAFLMDYSTNENENNTLEEDYFIEYVKLYKKYKNKKQTRDEWLKLFIQPTDKIIIISPCHETNSRFINMVNEIVFNLSAIVIHYQTNVDFTENFQKLHSGYLESENTKIFFVDDSLISGKHFFNLYDLVKNTKGRRFDQFIGTIVLSDKSAPFIHNRIVKLSKSFFAFISYNQPTSITLSSHKPLEHEQKKYDALAKYSLYDVLIKVFKEKSDDLNPDKIHNNKYGFCPCVFDSVDIKCHYCGLDPESVEYNYKEEKLYRKEKQLQHIAMFKTTHKIYEYFASDNNIFNLTNLDDFQEKLKLNNKNDWKDNLEKKIILLKVLSQYPFILYQPLKEKIFEWHNAWISRKFEEFERKIKNTIFQEDNILSEENYKKYFSYDDFKELKYLIRRSVFLNNYIILQPDILQILQEIISMISNKNNIIRKYDKIFDNNSYQQDLFDQDKKSIQMHFQLQDLNKKEKENLKNFPIFLLQNYKEMIFKNGWVAIKLLKNLETIKDIFNTLDEKRFIRMLKIEASSVIDDFMNMIVKEYKYSWRDMYQYTLETKYNHDSKDKILNKDDMISSLDYISDFFRNKTNDEKFLIENNKYDISLDILKIDKYWFEKNTCNKSNAFKNYLWIKQLLYTDIDHGQYSIKIISYQEKIDAIILKMKGFFCTEKIQAFFIVTDGQGKPHILSQDDDLFNEFVDEYEDCTNNEQKNYNTQTIINFLKGDKSDILNSTKTAVEFIKYKDTWIDLYDNEDNDKKEVNLRFMSESPAYKWLYLIRISKLNEDNIKKYKFDPQGLLGFYSTENLSDNILPKQLLMLLRKDISAFINKHHKNDEFTGLILRKEKEHLLGTVKHGIEEYENSIEIYFNRICNIIPCKDNYYNQLHNYYYFAFNHLIKKINLMHVLSEINPDDSGYFQKYKIIDIIKIFNNDYPQIMKFSRPGLAFFNEENKLDDFIELDNKTENHSKYLQDAFIFPRDFLEEMIFELIFNIRKYGFNFNAGKIIEDRNRLKITLDIKNIDDVDYFVVSNNYCFFDVRQENLKRSIKKITMDGLSLINNILINAKIGRLLITIDESKELKNRIINIHIPLKKEKHCE